MAPILRAVLRSLSCAAFLIAAFLAIGLWSPAGAQTPGAETSLGEARAALAEGRYLDVSRIIATIPPAARQHPEMAILQGELALRLDDPTAALTAFRGTEQLSPGNAEALQGEGLALSRLSRWDEASAALTRAVEAQPAAWRAWNALGVCHDRRGDWAGSEAAYARALEHSDRIALVLNNRGYSRMLQHRAEPAIEDFTAALRREPSLIAARTNLRLALAMTGDYQRAMAAAPLFAEDPAAILNNVAVAAASRGDLDQARALLRRAIKAHGAYYAAAEQNLQAIAPPNQATEISNAAR